jgi:hypothetical protein
MHAKPKHPITYGLLAEFDDQHSLVDAAHRAHVAGYTKMDAYSPLPIEELHHAMALPTTKLPALVLAGGLCGALGGFLLQTWVATMAYPLNIGGKPMFSWPMFIPVTFECTILGAALTTVFGMLALNGLPQPYHPVFNVPSFALASRDRFFLCIEAKDDKFDLDDTRRFLQSVGAKEVSVVED